MNFEPIVAELKNLSTRRYPILPRGHCSSSNSFHVPLGKGVPYKLMSNTWWLTRV